METETVTVTAVSPKLVVETPAEDSPLKKTPKRKSAVDRHRQESEELLKNMGANPEELDGRRRTRSSAVKSTTPAASPAPKKSPVSSVPRSGRKKKADEEKIEELEETVPKKSPPRKKQKLADKIDKAEDPTDDEVDGTIINNKNTTKEKPIELAAEKTDIPEVVKENDVEMNNVEEVESGSVVEKPVAVKASKKEDKIEETLEKMEVDNAVKPVEVAAIVTPVVKVPEVVPVVVEIPEPTPIADVLVEPSKPVDPAVVPIVENNVVRSEAVIENSTNEISEVEKTVVVTPLQEAKIESTDEPKLATTETVAQ